jgi:hypothetical protein
MNPGLAAGRKRGRCTAASLLVGEEDAPLHRCWSEKKMHRCTAASLRVGEDEDERPHRCRRGGAESSEMVLIWPGGLKKWPRLNANATSSPCWKT